MIYETREDDSSSEDISNTKNSSLVKTNDSGKHNLNRTTQSSIANKEELPIFGSVLQTPQEMPEIIEETESDVFSMRNGDLEMSMR